jgi:hypothetical protein
VKGVFLLKEGKFYFTYNDVLLILRQILAVVLAWNVYIIMLFGVGKVVFLCENQRGVCIGQSLESRTYIRRRKEEEAVYGSGSRGTFWV